MGERVYIPILGRFISTDPIEGGTDNDYVYPVDPVNDFDLTGQRGFKAFFKKAAGAASWASVIPGPVGMAASGVAAAAYAAAGDKKNAVIAAAGIAAAAVGAGGAWQVAKTVKAAGGLKAVATATLNKAASRTWAGGAAKMEAHFAKHGADMGYKTAWGYTAGAYKSTARSIVAHTYKNGRQAFMSKNLNLTVMQGGKLITFFKPSFPSNYWIRNISRR